MAFRTCVHSRLTAQSALAAFCRPACDVPTFLAPSLATQARYLSSTAPQRSKIGAIALTVPEGVSFQVSAPQTSGLLNVDQLVEVSGPLGKLSMNVPSFVSITAGEEGKTRLVAVQNAKEKRQRAMWGTVRALLNNHILGVSEGHTAILRLIGVGYRATVEDKAVTKQPEYAGQKFVSLKVGYSHPIELGVPQGVKASTPQPTRILLEGINKEVVMQFAALIRAWRKPEPYKGKGIFVNGETIKLKAKKIK